MKWEIEFYQDSQGNIPVQDFIYKQSAKVKAKILKYTDLLQEFGLSLGQPYIEKLTGSDVWELRIRHGSNRYRILYFASSGHKFILLHAFLKKTAKTPKNEIEIAQSRIIDYKARYTPQVCP
jgi:phage-related protein